jgi:hypothetical protein
MDLIDDLEAISFSIFGKLERYFEMILLIGFQGFF